MRPKTQESIFRALKVASHEASINNQLFGYRAGSKLLQETVAARKVSGRFRAHFKVPPALGRFLVARAPLTIAFLMFSGPLVEPRPCPEALEDI